MKWIDAKTTRPPADGYYIIRASYDGNSDDCLYTGAHFDDGEWITDEGLEDCEITHFIIPAEI